MAVTDYQAAPKDPTGNVSAQQVNIAWRDKYGEDAPAQVLNEMVGHVGGTDTGFYERVQKGDFNPQYFAVGGAGTGEMGFQEASTLALKRLQEANKPAIASYEASIPEIQSSYGAQKSNIAAQGQTLADRYKVLIDSITQNKTKSVNEQTRLTSSEMGKRGLLPSSTYVGQELQNRIDPINQAYGTQLSNAALDQTTGQQQLQALLNQITSGEVSDIRTVRNAIAQLQSGAGQTSVTMGQSMADTSKTNALAKQAFDFAKRQYEEITLPESKAKLAQSQTTGLADLWKAFGLG